MSSLRTSLAVGFYKVLYIALLEALFFNRGLEAFKLMLYVMHMNTTLLNMLGQARSILWEQSLAIARVGKTRVLLQVFTTFFDA